MPTQTWRVVVTKLGGSEVVSDVEVAAANWMAALRAGRERMGEPGSLPAGASCTVDARGQATVLDPSLRRKFVLSPSGLSSSVPRASEVAHASAPTPARAEGPAQQATPSDPIQAPAPRTQRKRFETVGFVAEHLKPQVAVLDPTQAASSQAVTASENAKNPPIPIGSAEKTVEASAAGTKKKRFETVAMIPNASSPNASAPATGPAREDVGARGAGASQRPASQRPASPATSSPRTSHSGLQRPRLDVLLERAAEPTTANPLTYREVAYFVPRGVSLPEAEAALRFELAEIQVKLAATPQGKLVNLAAFDHRWDGAPDRPPIVALQWRDWRPEVVVDYPAARLSSPPPPAPPSAPSTPPGRHDDRLDEAFHGLEPMTSLVAPVEALDLAVSLLLRMVPCEAITAALYDINTDELRFVSVYGTGADAVQGKAVPRSAGLFGEALRDELRPSLFGDVLLEASFDANLDSRPGVDARSMLVCPISNDGHLLGALQLINRSGSPVFSQGDASVLGYIAERLSEFLSVARRRARSEPPTGSHR